MLADLLGVPTEWAFEGVAYKVRPPNQVEQKQFSRHLERRYREWVEQSTDLGEDRQQKLLQAGGLAAAAGAFEWGSDAYVEAMGKPVTLAYMLYLVLRGENPDKGVTEELCLRMVGQKLAEIAAVLHAEAQDDPKKAEAALAAVGLPPSYWRPSGTSTSGSPTHPSTSPPNSSAG
jgi:hypothetical protein